MFKTLQFTIAKAWKQSNNRQMNKEKVVCMPNGILWSYYER